MGADRQDCRPLGVGSAVDMPAPSPESPGWLGVWALSPGHIWEGQVHLQRRGSSARGWATVGKGLLLGLMNLPEPLAFPEEPQV